MKNFIMRRMESMNLLAILLDSLVKSCTVFRDSFDSSKACFSYNCSCVKPPLARNLSTQLRRRFISKVPTVSLVGVLIMESMMSSEYRVILMSELKTMSHENSLSEPSPNFSVLKKISWLVQMIFCSF